nr:uncharacterized protein LOC110282149 [Parasteatoda tepidariorum]
MTDNKKSEKLKCLLKYENKHMCVLCYLFIKSTDVIKHLLSHIGALPFFCVTCKDTFLSETHFENHKSEHLPKSFTTVSIYPCIHQCNICDLVLPDNYQHILHYFEHLLQLNIKCIICNLYFSNFKDFSIHQHIHEHNFSCQICGYAERDMQLLFHHVVQHSPNKFFQNFVPTYFSKSSEDSYNLKTNDYLLNRWRKSMNSEIERDKLSKKLCTSGTNDSSLNDGMKTSKNKVSKTNICISQNIKSPLNSNNSETPPVLGDKVSNFHDKMKKGNRAPEFNISVSKQIKSARNSNSSKTPVLSDNDLLPEIASFTRDISLANTATYSHSPCVVRLSSDNNDSLQKLATSVQVKANNDLNSCDGFRNCVVLGTKSNVSLEINNKTSQTLNLIHNEHICCPPNSLTLNLQKIFNHSETIKQEEEPIEVNDQVINDCRVSGHLELNNQNSIASSRNVEQDSGLVKVKLEFEVDDVLDSQKLNSTLSHFSDYFVKETGVNSNLHVNGQEEVLTDSEIPYENSERNGFVDSRNDLTVGGQKKVLTDTAIPCENSEINVTAVGERSVGGQKEVLTDLAIYNRNSKTNVREKIDATNNITKKLQPGSVVLRKLASHSRDSTLIPDETLEKISRIDLPVIDATNGFIQKLQPCSVVLRKLDLSQDWIDLSTFVPNQNLAHANDINKLNNPLKQKSIVSDKLPQDSIHILSLAPNQNSDGNSSKKLTFANDANKLSKQSVVSNKLSQDSLNAPTFSIVQSSQRSSEKDISSENHANVLNKQCLVVLEKLSLPFNDIVQRSSELDISVENDINVLNEEQCSVVLHKLDPFRQDSTNVSNISFRDSFEGSSASNVILAKDNMANKKLKQCSVVLHKLPLSVQNFDSYLIYSKSVNCTPATYEEVSKKKFVKFLKRLKKKFKNYEHAQTLIKYIRKTKYKKVNSKRSKKLNKNLCQLCDIVYDKYKFKKFKYLKINSVKNSNSSRLFNDATSSKFKEFRVKKIETRIKSIRNFLKSQEKTV